MQNEEKRNTKTSDIRNTKLYRSVELEDNFKIRLYGNLINLQIVIQ